MYYKIFSLLFISFFFISCAQKENIYKTPLDILHDQAITQTQKTVLKEGENIRVFITATYLNEIEHPLAGVNREMERFVISVYAPQGDDDTLLDSLRFQLENSQNIITTKELKSDDPLLKILPFANPWAKHYLFETQSVQSRILKLQVMHEKYGNALLSFAKYFL